MNITFIPAKCFTPSRFFQKPYIFVIHWIAGDLAGADAVFKSGSRNSSSHFAIEESTVHQYVQLNSTAYHAGNWLVNLHSVGFEVSAQPGRDATDLTYETTAQTMVQAAKQLGLSFDQITFRRHGEIVATQCCGTVNKERIVARVKELMVGSLANVDQPISSNPIPAVIASAPRNVPTSFFVTVTNTLRVRTAPTTSAPDVPAKLLHKGDTVEIAEVVPGDVVAGNGVWLRTRVSGLYIWSGATSYHP